MGLTVKEEADCDVLVAALEFLLASNAYGTDCDNPRFDGGDEWVTNVDAFRHAKAAITSVRGRKKRPLKPS